MDTSDEIKHTSLLPLPEPTTLPQWWAPALLALAIAWAALLQTRESELAGISVPIVEMGYLGLLLAYYLRRSSVDWFGWTLAGSALAAAAWFAVWRSEDMGTYLSLILWGLNLALPAYLSGAMNRTWDTLRGIRVAFRIVGSFFRTLGPASAVSARSLALTGRSGAAARYGASALVLVAILLLLVPLLTEADPAFAHLVRQIVPDWLYELGFVRIVNIAIWTLAYAAAVGAHMLAPSRIPAESPEPRAWNPPSLSWPLILGGIVALYAVYIGVQVRYFFLAADANVYQALGLTYAEYIHRGFYELLSVSGLNLLIAKVSWELARGRSDRPSPMVRILIGLVLACAVVIACSGISRAWHYVAAYGLSVERALVIYASILAIGVFAVGVVKLACPRLREMPIAAALAIVSFVALAHANVESAVARYNIATQPLDELDTEYIVEDLSEDALDEKLWVLRNDPNRVLRTRTDWACDRRMDEAREVNVPLPTCSVDVDVTNRDAFYEWMKDARDDANESDILEPPSWVHANYASYRLYYDPDIIASYGEKLSAEAAKQKPDTATNRYDPDNMR